MQRKSLDEADTPQQEKFHQVDRGWCGRGPSDAAPLEADGRYRHLDPKLALAPHPSRRRIQSHRFPMSIMPGRMRY